jgi:predicted histone-like DNA-binding protein
MAVHYILTEKTNPANPGAPKKWYAIAKSAGEVDLRSLGKQITQRCTVNYADTLAVIEGLLQVLSEQLEEGMIVRFGDLGSFQVTISSSGVDTQEQFHASMIRGSKVSFRPGKVLKDMLKSLHFIKS